MNFTYQAKTSTGGFIEGTIDAPSEEQAILLLQQKELFVLSLLPKDGNVLKIDLLSFFQRPTRKDVVVFTRQLATLIDADVPLLEALSILGRQSEKESFRKIIATIVASVQGGATLSVAFADHERVFNPFYTSLLRVGEISGKMQETLNYLADYLERSAGLNSKIKGAIFYPTFVLSALVVVAIIMMTTVIPQLLTVIKESGATELPLPTKMLIATSNFFQHYWAIIIVAVVLLVIGTYHYIRTERGRYVWDSFKLSMPKFGNIIRALYLARIAETLATLVHSSVPILESLQITADVVGNEVYKRILMEAHQNVQSGGTLSATLAEYPEFPKLVSSMISTGERTGRIDAMLNNVLKFYRTEAEDNVQNLSQLVEPILILILGVGIGLLVAAILLPIYSLINTV
ncbi:MAG: type II secretion system F family protein [Patescibacteria group bacterium]